MILEVRLKDQNAYFADLKFKFEVLRFRGLFGFKC